MPPLFPSAAADGEQRGDTALRLFRKGRAKVACYSRSCPIGGMPMPRFWDGGICVLITGNPPPCVKKENTGVSFSARTGSGAWAATGPSTQRKVFSVNVGIKFAVSLSVMNKYSQILRPRQKLSLGDLIVAVSSCAKSSRETVATVADLLGSGRVRVEDHGRFLRAKVC